METVNTDLLYKIDDTPTVNIKPEMAYWIGNFTPYRCDNCGHYSDDATPYCPHCGRKMETTYDD